MTEQISSSRSTECDSKHILRWNTTVLQVTEFADYYLLIEGRRYLDWSRKVNSYGYQGNYAEFDARTVWNKFVLRNNLDSKLGRWEWGIGH